MIQSLIGSEVRSDICDLPVADGIKEMLINRGFTRDKILNTNVSTMAETLQIDYYVALPSMIQQNNKSIGFNIVLGDINVTR